MTKLEMDVRLLERVCCGPVGAVNAQAMDFLANYWSPYVHGIDDIIDGDRDKPEDVLRTFALAAMLYSHPFYVQHLLELRSLVLVITNTYADAVAWERSGIAWQRDWADHHRHAGMDMVIAVAQICGGYGHGRAISQEQRVVCWAEHHDREGVPD